MVHPPGRRSPLSVARYRPVFCRPPQPSGGLPGRRPRPQQATGLCYMMMEVCKGWVKGPLPERVATTGLRREERFPPRRLNARCRFSKEIFAGVRGNGRDATILAVRRPGWNREVQPNCDIGGASSGHPLPNPTEDLWILIVLAKEH